MTEKKNKGGRPTKFKPEYIQQAYNYCLLGATDDDLAEFFGVDVSTIGNWKVAHTEFYESLQKGKEFADMEVAGSLFKKATGYTRTVEKPMVINGVLKIVEYEEHLPPDTTAGIFWVKNRRSKHWRDKQDVALTGENGGPVQVVTLSQDEYKQARSEMLADDDV